MPPFRRKPRRKLEALADEELVQLVQDGDTEPFSVIYDRHSTAAYSLAYRIVGQRGAAENVVQEAFLALWRSLDRFDASRGSLRTFLLGIVRNRAIDGLRRASVHQGRDIAGDDSLAERIESPDRVDTEVVRREGADRLRGALSELPDDQQKVIHLAYFGGFSQTEIAEMLEAPLGTVKGRMRLALEKLRTQLGEDPVEAWR
ncbi:MAG TPA: sigma-70 family RNA polymerase sigma factor [Solirubrobacteraceae bacterium]|nr:sigma-70 family RNA polymerase sigma factor [Solirubrobacteraceae bacterium]